MLIELGYVTVDLLHAEAGLSREAIIAETALLQAFAILDLASQG